MGCGAAGSAARSGRSYGAMRDRAQSRNRLAPLRAGRENPGSVAPRGEKPAAPAWPNDKRTASLRSAPDLRNEFFDERVQGEAPLVPLLPAPDRDRPVLHLL